MQVLLEDVVTIRTVGPAADTLMLNALDDEKEGFSIADIFEGCKIDLRF
jgi:hypothetical protein